MKSATPKILLLLSIFSQINSQTLNIVTTSKLPFGRREAVAIYDGSDSIYIFGGWISSTYPSVITQFHLTSETITYPGSMTNQSQLGDGFWSDSSNSAIYFGGHFGDAVVRNSIIKYTPGSSTTQEIGTFPTGTYATSTVLIGEDAYIFGNAWDGRRNIVMKLSPNGSVSDLEETLPYEVFGSSSTFIEDLNCVLIFGGYNYENNWLDTIILFNVTSRSFKILDEKLPVMVTNPFAFNNGTHAYIIGGNSPTLGYTGLIQIQIDTMEIQQIPVINGSPAIPGACFAYVEELKRVYIFGGRIGSEDNKEIMYLSF